MGHHQIGEDQAADLLATAARRTHLDRIDIAADVARTGRLDLTLLAQTPGPHRVARR